MSTWYLSTEGIPVPNAAPAWLGAADFDAAAEAEGFTLQESRSGVQTFEHDTEARWLFSFGWDHAHVVLVETFPEYIAFLARLGTRGPAGFAVRSARR